jgi:tRNA (guanine37-N1)-methyltransferase
LVDCIATSSSSTTTPIIVADACAGVGPFAIPLACRYKNIQVYANDLNPTSYQYLQINRDRNKCMKNVHVYNMDARLFLRQLEEVEGIRYHHVIMNLPAIAPEFLNVFRGFSRQEDIVRPILHVYCFAGKGLNYQEEVLKRCSDALGCSLCIERDEVSFHIVRDVSPNKNMICVSFRLPLEVQSLPRIDTFAS